MPKNNSISVQNATFLEALMVAPAVAFFTCLIASATCFSAVDPTLDPKDFLTETERVEWVNDISARISGPYLGMDPKSITKLQVQYFEAYATEAIDAIEASAAKANMTKIEYLRVVYRYIVPPKEVLKYEQFKQSARDHFEILKSTVQRIWNPIHSQVNYVLLPFTKAFMAGKIDLTEAQADVLIRFNQDLIALAKRAPDYRVSQTDFAGTVRELKELESLLPALTKTVKARAIQRKKAELELAKNRSPLSADIAALDKATEALAELAPYLLGKGERAPIEKFEAFLLAVHQTQILTSRLESADLSSLPLAEQTRTRSTLEDSRQTVSQHSPGFPLILFFIDQAKKTSERYSGSRCSRLFVSGS